jgi:hypothetical protein
MATNQRQTERETSEAVHQTGRMAADAGERVARAGSEAARAAQSSWRESSEAATRIAERSMEQFSKMWGVTGDNARETLQQSSGNLQAIMESTTVIVGGLQHLSGEWMQFAQNSIERNLSHLDQLQGCRSFQDFAAAQTQMFRDTVESVIHSARRNAEHTTRIAEEATRRMGDATLAPR